MPGFKWIRVIPRDPEKDSDLRAIFAQANVRRVLPGDFLRRMTWFDAEEMEIDSLEIERAKRFIDVASRLG